MTKDIAYRNAIMSVIADQEYGDEDKIDVLKVLFKDLHYAEKHEMETAQGETE